MNDAQPEITRGKRFSAIWIIPILALVLGIYMVIHTKMTEGPTITIAFKTAEGLEAGKTKIQFRNVQIGLIEEVHLTDDFSGVIATAKLDRSAIPLLKTDTQMWVVRARVGAGSVTGIGTILSGAYIELAPGRSAKKSRKFVGLEQPPLTPADAPGIKLTLTTDRAGSVSTGDSVLYHGYKVGRVESMRFDSDEHEVRYDIFIDAPFNDLVTTSTRFWNSSGVTVNASAEGIDIETGSLDTILLGGVAFDVPEGMPPGDKVAQEASFRLFRSYKQTVENPFKYGTYYVASFKQSLRGLEPGAPVEYRGLHIGRVERILFQELAKAQLNSQGSAIPVLIYLEPGRMQMGDSPEGVERFRANIATGITDGGLRASLQTGSLLTGKLFISMDFHDDLVADSVPPTQFGEYTVIPSMSSGLERLEKQVSSLLVKLNSLPLETTVTDANSVLASLDTTLASVNAILKEGDTRQLPGELTKLMAELRDTLAGLAPDSQAYQSLNSTIFELNKTLYNLEELTRNLKQTPSSILFPAPPPVDPIPEAHRP